MSVIMSTHEDRHAQYRVHLEAEHVVSGLGGVLHCPALLAVQAINKLELKQRGRRGCSLAATESSAVRALRPSHELSRKDRHDVVESIGEDAKIISRQTTATPNLIKVSEQLEKQGDRSKACHEQLAGKI